ncbi:hypothetical protein D3C87_2131780 [compost metagenome]
MMRRHGNNLRIERLAALAHFLQLGGCLLVEHFVGSSEEESIFVAEVLVIIVLLPAQ